MMPKVRASPPPSVAAQLKLTMARLMAITSTGRGPRRFANCAQSGIEIAAARKNRINRPPDASGKPSRSSTKNTNSVDVMARGSVFTSDNPSRAKPPERLRSSNDRLLSLGAVAVQMPRLANAAMTTSTASAMPYSGYPSHVGNAAARMMPIRLPPSRHLAMSIMADAVSPELSARVWP